MNKLVLALSALAVFSGSAMAADLAPRPYTKAPAPVVAGVSWTGCYIAGGGGGGMFRQEHQTVDPAGVPIRGFAGSTTTGGSGWLGTVQGGCDYQFASRWVVGAFVDGDFTNIKGNMAPTAGNGVFGSETLAWSWAAGGRIGYLVFPQFLSYFTAGYTQAHFNGVDFLNPATLVSSGTTLDAQTYNGWFLGAGDEYALDFLPGLFWKTEYRYARYSEASPAIRNAGGAIVAFERGTKDVQTVRTELVYRFNWGGPVVAKY